MARIDFDEDNHRYTVDGVELPSPTTVLSATFPKYLTGWAANMAADYAITHWGALTQLDADTRRTQIKDTHDRYSKARMQRGTAIHKLCEQIIYGGAVDATEYPEEAEAFARFVDEWDIRPIATETLLAAPTIGYAGAADLWATIGALDNQPALIDIKTGSGIYREYAVQLAAYRFAEFITYDDGREAAPPEVEAAYCVHIERPRPRGYRLPAEAIDPTWPRTPPRVRLVPVSASTDDFRLFTQLLEFYRWQKSTRPVGRALSLPKGVAA